MSTSGRAKRNDEECLQIPSNCNEKVKGNTTLNSTVKTLLFPLLEIWKCLVLP